MKLDLLTSIGMIVVVIIGFRVIDFIFDNYIHPYFRRKRAEREVRKRVNRLIDGFSPAVTVITRPKIDLLKGRRGRR